jgi:biopolymer transport protein ExbB
MNELIKQGGIIIYPLLAASIVALAIILERFIYYGNIKREIPEKVMLQLKDCLKNGEQSKALRLFSHSRNPVHLILSSGILAWERGYEEMEREMEEVKMMVFPRMERRLSMLHFIGIMSPSLGLLGTVTGMIKTFHFLSLNLESQQLAGGISEALITTAFGLSISIPALAAYYYFINKLEHVVTHSEKRELELIHYAQKSGDIHAQI